MRKISIIIPCYNVAPYIDRCMASIAVQTIGMDSLEIICIDDASTDDTWAHLRKWEQVFPDQINFDSPGDKQKTGRSQESWTCLCIGRLDQLCGRG